MVVMLRLKGEYGRAGTRNWQRRLWRESFDLSFHLIEFCDLEGLRVKLRMCETKLIVVSRTVQDMLLGWRRLCAQAQNQDSRWIGGASPTVPAKRVLGRMGGRRTYRR